MTSDWTTPEDIRAQVRQDWDRGRILSGRLTNGSIYPKPTRFKRPDSKALGSQFGKVQDWIAELVRSSRDGRRRGYEIEWEELKHQQLGRNRVPARVVIPSDEDAAFLIGRLQDLKRWDQVVSRSIATFPALQPWFERRPLAVLEAIDEWDHVLSVLSWFVGNPRSGLYLRQLDITGVNTKFVESRRALFDELLGYLLPGAVDLRAKRESFEARFGLRDKPLRVRFRFLDPEMNLSGLTDIEANATEFARHPLPVDRVFIVENEVNFLSFPPAPRALVVWGGGYSIDRIREAAWLSSRDLIYWGDIDTHGFGILDRLRSMFPSVRSFLMDRETLLGHQHLWVAEPKPRNDQLSRLTTLESAVYDELRENRLGERLRLEQERVRYGLVVDALKRVETTVHARPWLEAAHTRNWLVGDPVLDWLEQFGSDRGLLRDDASPGYDRDLDFELFLQERASEFRDDVLRHLANRTTLTRIVDEGYEARERETLANMQRGAELIAGAVLENARRRVRVRPHLLVRADVAPSLFPSLARNVATRARAHYLPIFVECRRLVLDREGRLAALQGNLPQVVVAWFASDTLGEVQGIVPDALVIGRAQVDSDENFHVAPVSFDRDGEQSIPLAADGALNWLSRLHAHGSKWSVSPTPSVPELYPHARTRSDAPWRRAKKQLAHELKELTLLPGMTPERRREAHAIGVREWSDPRASAASLGLPVSKAAERLDAVLMANRDGVGALVPLQLETNASWRTPAATEFFVDFETAHDEDSAARRIVMIGCGHLDADGWQFGQWIAHSLREEHERDILDRWLERMRSVCERRGCSLTEARLVHWSHAERSAFRAVFDGARARHAANDWPEALSWFDLLEQVFRAEPIGVKGAFDYGLKSIAKAMHAAGLIETRWDDDSLDGLAAMVGIMRAAQRTEALPTSALVRRIAKYNETDCRVVAEILHYLRTKR